MSLSRRPFPPGPVGPIVDPASSATMMRSQQLFPVPVGVSGGDPPPPDLGRFTLAQLESSLHTIAAERARLDSMETMIQERMTALRRESPKG